MAERLPEHVEARRRRGSFLQTALGSRDDRDMLVWLERALAEARTAADMEAAFIAALPPCRMCGRKVATPCNDAEGYYEGGPWDNECEGYARG